MDVNRLITDERAVDGMPIADGWKWITGAAAVVVVTVVVGVTATATAAGGTAAAGAGGFAEEDTGIGNYAPVDIDDDHLFWLQFGWHGVTQRWHAAFAVARRRRRWCRRQYESSCKIPFVTWIQQ